MEENKKILEAIAKPIYNLIKNIDEHEGEYWIQFDELYNYKIIVSHNHLEFNVNIEKIDNKRNRNLKFKKEPLIDFLEEFKEVQNIPPKNKVILVYTDVTGWYASKWDSLEKPFPYYNWEKSGVWYPKPCKWKYYNGEDANEYDIPKEFYI